MTRRSTIGGFLLLACSAAVLVVPSVASADVGDCPFPTNISTQEELIQLGTDSDCLDETITQTGDIFLTLSPWTPIDEFEGVYDGNSNAIYGLELNGDNAGLFNVGDAGATFENLSIVVRSSEGGDNVGAVVGYSSGPITIQNVHIRGNISGESYVGGLVGQAINPFENITLDITNTSVEGNITGTDNYIGGLISYTNATEITFSGVTITGNLEGADYVGGLVGQALDPFENITLDITNTTVEGNITGTDDNIGGLIGYTNATDITIDDTELIGDADGSAYVGGLVGQAINPFENITLDITNTTVEGNITGTDDYIGGLIGYTNATVTTFSSVTNTGDIEGAAYVGGLIGTASNPLENITLDITNTTVEGDITGTDFVGGVISYTNATDITISGITIAGDLSGTSRVGGIIGDAFNVLESIALDITNTTVEGDITGGSDVGGVIGDTNATDITISGITIAGDLSGTSRVGGIIGDAFNVLESIALDITNTDVTGNITGTDDYIGGLIGETNATDITIDDGELIGNTDGDSYVGGIIGSVYRPFDDVTLDITNTDVAGNITGTDGYTGGLIGDTNATDITIDNTTVTGDLSGTSRVGGIIGNTNRPFDDVTLDITNTDVTGNITGTDGYIGGLIGETDALTVTIAESSVAGDLSGTSRVGGIIGNTYRPFDDVTLDITNTDVAGNITGTDDYIGGLIGDTNATDITIAESSVVGTITGFTNYVGGMFGYLSSLETVEITESFFSGGINGGLYVGGLIGFSMSGTISTTNSFVRAESRGARFVGGLIGSTSGEIVLTDSYFQGSVDASVDYAGPLYGVGPVDPSDVVIDGALCAATNCPVDAAVTISDLRSATFLTTLGWDLTSVWCVRADKNDGFPLIQGFSMRPFDCDGRQTHRHRRRVTLDPAGGTCGVHSEPWAKSFRISYNLPTSSECTRSGFVLLGWTRDPFFPTSEQILTSEARVTGRLTAVWGAHPSAPTSIDVIANFLCEENCTAAIVVWPTSTNPTDTAQIVIDNTDAICSLSGQVFGFRWCWITGLTPQTTHTTSVAWRNDYGTGPATNTTFTLN